MSHLRTEATPTYFRVGDHGDAVAEIRTRLTTLGLVERDSGDPAHFDEPLDRAVRAFQQQRGITAVSYTHLTLPTILRV